MKADFAHLGRLHRQPFLASLVVAGIKENQLSRVALALGPVHFDRNTDRSVLGALRVADIDLSWLLQDAPNVMKCDPLALAVKMNTRPTTVRGKWLFPDKAMPELIERL